MARLSRRLHQDAGELRERPDRLAGQVGHALNLLHPLVDRGCAFEFHRLRRGVALAFQPGEHGSAAGGEKGKDICRFLPVPLIGAALETRCETHLHLGINTAGKSGIGAEVVGAAAQQKQIEHLIRDSARPLLARGTDRKERWPPSC